MPQYIDVTADRSNTVVFFRTSREREKTVLRITLDGQEIYKKTYRSMRPPEMVRVPLDLSKVDITQHSSLKLTMEEGEQ